MASQPPATLSLDLDNQWAYLRVHGDAGWESFPSYLDQVVPRILNILAAYRVRITFFVVGQDAALPRNREALGKLGAAGHEIANHSFEHRPSLARQAPADIEDELARAEEAIEGATGQRPKGFRGPGFCCSPALLEALARRGYSYDASTFPTLIAPLARAYYLLRTPSGSPGQEERAGLFGGWRQGLRPLRPFFWQVQGAQLLEIPVTTLPFFRTPIHLTYLLYLAGLSPRLALAYFRAAIRLCRATRTPPSLLLHPLDFLGRDDVPALAFFPGMALPGEQKRELVARVLELFCGAFAPLPLTEFAQRHAAGLRSYRS
jgi:hypothetical protein